MRVIIAGSRGITDYEEVKKAVNASGFNITEVVSGKARGVDTLGEQWADENGIPVKPFPAKWGRGMNAGHIRNGEMAEYAHALIALWDGKSTGTADMIKKAHAKNLYVYVRKIK